MCACVGCGNVCAGCEHGCVECGHICAWYEQTHFSSADKCAPVCAVHPGTCAMSGCVHVCVYTVCMCICVYSHACACLYRHFSVCACVSVYIHFTMCAHMSVDVCACLCVYMCMQIPAELSLGTLRNTDPVDRVRVGPCSSLLTSRLNSWVRHLAGPRPTRTHSGSEQPRDSTVCVYVGGGGPLPRLLCRSRSSGPARARWAEGLGTGSTAPSWARSRLCR